MTGVSINRGHIKDLPRPDYIKWMVSEAIELDGVSTKCYRLDWEIDEALLDAWSLHVRRHYIRDDELLEDCDEFEMGADEYLREYCIPGRTRLGNAARSGDFAEMLISDALQFIEGYESSRYKQTGRTNKDNSDQGSDVIAYKVNDPLVANPDDVLCVVEVKARLSKPYLKEAIENAAKDSKKDTSGDLLRLGASLRSISKKSRIEGDETTAGIARRFMNKVERPYVLEKGAAAVVSMENIEFEMKKLKADQLGLMADEKLIVVHGKRLMDLAHSIFDRCMK